MLANVLSPATLPRSYRRSACGRYVYKQVGLAPCSPGAHTPSKAFPPRLPLAGKDTERKEAGTRGVCGPSDPHHFVERCCVRRGRELQQSSQTNNRRARAGQRQLRARICRNVAMAGGEETVRVRIEMDAGRLELELYPSRAPLTVANFLQYVDAGNLPHTSTWNTIG